MIKLKGRDKRHQRGSVILSALMISVGLATAMYLLPDILQKYETSSENDRYVFEARMLSRDMIDLGKYLMTYERVFFLDKPTLIPSSTTSPVGDRLSAMKEIWNSPMTASSDPNANDYPHVCNWYDTIGYAARNAMAVKKDGIPAPGLDQQPAFCPAYLRTNLFSGPMLESVFFNGLTNPGVPVPSILKKTGAGVYRLDVDLTDALKLDPAHFIELNTGQKLLNTPSLEVKGSLVFEFYGSASGFGTKLSERYIKISSRVQFKYLVNGLKQLGITARPTMVSDTETIMIVPSTGKDFALFLLYTQKETPRSPGDPPTQSVFPGTGLIPNENWDPTSATSPITGLSPDSEIYGRTFYRGGMVAHKTDAITHQIDFSDLPIFHDVVILDGNLKVKPTGVTTAFIPPPSQYYIDQIKARFEKGLIPNFSARRFIVLGGGAGTRCGLTPFSSETGFNCVNELDGIVGQFDNYSSACKGGKWIVSNGGSSKQCKLSGANILPFNGICVDPAGDTSCDTTKVSNLAGISPTDAVTRETPVMGWSNEIEIRGSEYNFIFGATKKISVTAKPPIGDTNIYGTLLGGQLKALAGHKMNFYSVANWTPDLVGIQQITGAGTSQDLDRNHPANMHAGDANSVVTFPLTGMPVVWSSREGMR